MTVLKNRYVLVLAFLALVIVGISIYAYASKSYSGIINNNNNKGIVSGDENNSDKSSGNQENKDTQNNNTDSQPAQPGQEPTPAEVPEYKVKGVYLTGWSAGRESRIDHFIELTKTTELNTLVIDVKDDEGRVSYKSNVPLANEIGSSLNMIADIGQLMKKLKDNKVHTIARIVVFKDPILGQKRPDLAFKTTSGGLWRDRTGAAWLNPYNEDSWRYSLDLAKEAVELGFDEVQFDYIRFPTDGKVKQIDYGEAGREGDMTIPINGFLAQAKKELAPLGVPVSADVFGIITTNIGDIEKIGQDLETISKDIDYISPMVYPSHYGVGQYGFAKPDFEPYKVVHKSLSTAKERLDKLEGHKAKIRPYLQDFTASWLGSGYYKKYTAQDVRTQIQATYDCGLEEWILWNANNKYSESAFLRE